MSLFDGILNGDKVSVAVDKLNDIKGMKNKFIYQYNATEKWYDIIHAVEYELQNNDELAKKISDILMDELIDNNIFNFSFYEDKQTIFDNTIEFVHSNKYSFDERLFNNSGRMKKEKIKKYVTTKKVSVTLDNFKWAV